MRKLFLITAIVLSATAAHAGLNTTVANADRSPQASSQASSQATEASSQQQRADADALAAKREAMMQQKAAMKKQMMMQKQMAMQREMQRHPIRTRLHFALLKFKRTMNAAFR